MKEWRHGKGDSGKSMDGEARREEETMEKMKTKWVIEGVKRKVKKRERQYDGEIRREKSTWNMS